LHGLVDAKNTYAGYTLGIVVITTYIYIYKLYLFFPTPKKSLKKHLFGEYYAYWYKSKTNTC